MDCEQPTEKRLRASTSERASASEKVDNTIGLEKKPASPVCHILSRHGPRLLVVRWI